MRALHTIVAMAPCPGPGPTASHTLTRLRARLPRRNERRNPSRSGKRQPLATQSRVSSPRCCSTTTRWPGTASREADLGRRSRFRTRRCRHPKRTQPVRARALRPEDTTHPELTPWRALRRPPACPTAGNWSQFVGKRCEWPGSTTILGHSGQAAGWRVLAETVQSCDAAAAQEQMSAPLTSSGWWASGPEGSL